VALGVGIDLIEIERVERALERRPRLALALRHLARRVNALAETLRMACQRGGDPVDLDQVDADVHGRHRTGGYGRATSTQTPQRPTIGKCEKRATMPVAA
jgi:hypothetical protein